MKYAVMLEKTKDNWSASVPDLPGCGSTGHTIAEALGNVREAIILHLSGLAEDGDAIPDPETLAEYVDVPAPQPYAQTPGVTVSPAHADLKAIRKAAKLTQQQLAAAAGVRQETISRIESGRRPLTSKMFRRIQTSVAGRGKNAARV